MTSSDKISVIIVDDSSVIRGALTRIIKNDPEIEIIASAENGQMAVAAANSKKPDVMLLDVEMPVMDGLTALPQILKSSPKTKVIMCSSLTAKGADISLRAMALGAIECIAKPSSATETGPGSAFQITLTNLIKTLGRANKAAQAAPVQPFTRPTTAPGAPQQPASSPITRPTTTPSTTAQPARPAPTAASAPKTSAASAANFTLHDDSRSFKGAPAILAIGSSTGGPQALFKVLQGIGKISIPIVITQHMPATFTKILAEHIGQQTPLTAHEGEDGMIVEAGKVYVAPGGYHMLFEKNAGVLKIKLDDGPQENFCKPAVDPMLRSLIDIYDSRVLCTILTGMGNDGQKGGKALVERGGRVIAQDQATSVVWGMPGAAATSGICSAVLPLDQIASWIKNEGRCV